MAAVFSGCDSGAGSTNDDTDEATSDTGAAVVLSDCAVEHETEFADGLLYELCFPCGETAALYQGPHQRSGESVPRHPMAAGAGGLPSAAFAGQTAVKEIVRLENRQRAIRPVWQDEGVEQPLA